MLQKHNNFAYIDGANLYRGIFELGWKMDYRKFRIWLSEKYGVTCAYLFLGFVPKYQYLYKQLKEDGFTLIFKEITHDEHGKIKGNCDADLVLYAVSDCYESRFEKAVLVGSDGDYASLVSFLLKKKRLITVISPSDKCSFLLRKINAPLTYLSTQKKTLEGR